MPLESFSQTVVPLSYTRSRGPAVVTGLTVTVAVRELKTDALLLGSTPMSETVSGSGVYVYNWTHGLSQDTAAMVTYTVNGSPIRELIYINVSGAYGPGRAT